MARLHRVAAWLLLAVGFAFGGQAWAIVCTQYTQAYNGAPQPQSLPNGWNYKTAQAACQAVVDTQAPIAGRVLGPGYIGGDGWCYSDGTYNGNPATSRFNPITSRTGDYCPDETCNEFKGQDAGVLRWSGTTSQPYICDAAKTTSTGAHCLMTGQRDISYQLGSSWQSSGHATYTGDTCVVNAGGDGSGPASSLNVGSSPPTQTQASTSKCNGYLGDVNGVVTCVPQAGLTGTVTPSTPTSNTTTSTTNGTTTTTTQDSSQSVACTPSTCTVTSNVTVNNNGTPTTTSTTSTVPLTTYCASNPTSAHCTGGSGTGGQGTDSAFGGGCNTAFVCTGDAVQCATAKAVNEQKCIFEKQGAESVLYDALKGSTSTGLSTSTTTISAASFDQANKLGVAGSCIPDVTTEVMGKAITISFSNVCTYLAYAGQVAFACAFLIAFGIVGRRVA